MGYDPPCAGHVSVSRVREDVASQTRAGRHYHSFTLLYFHTEGAVAEGSLQHSLDAQTQDDEKIIWNHFILRVCCDSIFAGKLQT